MLINQKKQQSQWLKRILLIKLSTSQCRSSLLIHQEIQPDAPTPHIQMIQRIQTKTTPDQPVPEIPGIPPEVPSVTPENPGK